MLKKYGTVGSYSDAQRGTDGASSWKTWDTITYIGNKYWFFRMYAGNRVDALHLFTPFLFESLNRSRLCPHQLAGSPSLLDLLLKPKAGSAQAELVVCSDGSVTAVIKYSLPALMLMYLILPKKGRSE